MEVKNRGCDTGTTGVRCHSTLNDSTADYFSGLPPRAARATWCVCAAEGGVGLLQDPAEQDGLWGPGWGVPTEMNARSPTRVMCGHITRKSPLPIRTA
eukprot:scaffold12183_cov112-Isochrysis_galbana.AAC.1